MMIIVIVVVVVSAVDVLAMVVAVNNTNNYEHNFKHLRNFLMLQWLRLQASNPGDLVSIPGQ